MENLKFYEPNNQNIVASPYFMENFDFTDEYGEASEEVRICRYLSQMLRIFGNDVVYNLEKSENVSLESDVFSITLPPGKIIQDSTLLSFPEITLSLDVSAFDYANDKAIVFTKFKYNTRDRTTETDNNPFVFRLGVYEESTGKIWQNSTTEYSWDYNINRVLITAYALDTLDYVKELPINGETYQSRGHQGSALPIVYDGGTI